MKPVKTMDTLAYLAARLKEPSSHTTVMFLAGLFNIPGVDVDNAQAVIALVLGLAAVLLPEGGLKDELSG